MLESRSPGRHCGVSRLHGVARGLPALNSTKEVTLQPATEWLLSGPSSVGKDCCLAAIIWGHKGLWNCQRRCAWQVCS